MKTQLMITAAAILFSINIANANPTRTALKFYDSMGKELIQPFFAEEATNSLPFEIAAEVTKIKKENACRIFDLSELTKPEQEEELLFDLETVFREAKK
jgi:putative heme degradation protein